MKKSSIQNGDHVIVSENIPHTRRRFHIEPKMNKMRGNIYRVEQTGSTYVLLNDFPFDSRDVEKYHDVLNKDPQIFHYDLNIN